MVIPSSGFDPPLHEVALLGLPTDEASSFFRGAAQGPQGTRQALYSESSNLWSEGGLDLGGMRDVRWHDLGDLELSGGAASRREIEAAVAQQLGQGRRVLSLGGDHAVSYPVLRAYGQHYSDLTVVQIDAHPDLYDEFEGDRYSHACPFARTMETGWIARLVQVGIRTATAHQREQKERFGVEWVERCHWGDPGRVSWTGPVYLSIDLDGFDPGCAPGVSHLEAGGLSPREGLDWIWRIPRLVGADVVELNPSRDRQGVTAALAAKLVKELLARLMETP